MPDITEQSLEKGGADGVVLECLGDMLAKGP